MVGASICVRTNDELKEWLRPEIYDYLHINTESLQTKIARLCKTGHLFNWNDWRNKLQIVCKGNTTFLEAYERTGRILNITAISESHRPVLLNYKTTPHIVIWSAVIASASLPLLMSPSP